MSVSRRFFLKSGALLSSLPLAATVAHAADPAATASRQVGPAPVRTTPVSDYIVDGFKVNPSAPIVLKGRRDLTLDVYRKVVWNHTSVSVDPTALKQIDAWRKEFLDFLAVHPELNVYGVNIKPGDAHKQRLTEEELKQNLSQGLNTGISFGEPLPNRVVRGIILARTSGMLGGNSASSAALTSHIIGMLGRKELPVVPREGQGGAGEVCPLGTLFDNIPREIHLGLKEPMTIINGHPTATALCVDLALRSDGIIKLTEQVLALAIDGLTAPSEHFGVQLEVCWDDPDEQKALQNIRAYLKDAPVPRRQNVQARVTVRDIPLILAAAYKAQRNLKQTAQTVLQSAHDNPLWIPKDQAAKVGAEPYVCSNGSYHSQIAMNAPDEIARNYADLATVLYSLVQCYYSDPVAMPGLDNLIYGNMQMNASDWQDETRMLGQPSLLPPPQFGQNDLCSPYMRAWNKVDRLEKVLAALDAQVACMASESIFIRGDLKTSPALQPMLDIIRKFNPPIDVAKGDRRTIATELDGLYNFMADSAMAYSSLDPEKRPALVLQTINF